MKNIIQKNNNTIFRKRKFLTKIKITHKLLAVFALTSFLPLLFISMYSKHVATKISRHAIEKTMHQTINSVVMNIESVFASMNRDMQYIPNTLPIQEIIKNRDDANSDSTSKTMLEWKSDLKDILTSIMLTKQIYQSLYFVDENGSILVKAVYNNGIIETDISEHQESIKIRPSFKQTIENEENEIYIHSKLKTSIVKNSPPVIECGVPVFHKLTKNRKGAIIAELILNNETTKTNLLSQGNDNFYLLSKTGDFILKSTKTELHTGINEILIKDKGFVRDKNSLITFSTISLNQENSNYFKIVYQTPPVTILKEVENSRLFLIVWIIIVLIISITIGYIYSKKFIGTILLIRNALKILSKGEHPKAIPLDSKDEIGDITVTLNAVVDNLRKTSNFALQIGKGNLTPEFKHLSDNDILGNSLIEMRNSLQKSKTEEQIRQKDEEKQNWTTVGITRFNDILRQSNDNIEELAYNIIKELVTYIDAVQGAIFTINDEISEDMFLELQAVFAYDRRKYLTKRLELKEGLVGRCALEQKTIYLTDLPEDYFNIVSGLGMTKSKSLLIVPLSINDKIFGILEIGALKAIEEYKIQFTEKVAETVASTISNVKINIRTGKLLEETRRQAEELSMKEEQMRQNMEELQATQEEAARKEAEATGFVNSVNHSIIRADFDLNGNLTYGNSKFMELMEYTSAEAIGQNVSIFIEEKDKNELKRQWKITVNGGKHIEQEMRHVTKNGHRWFLSTFTSIKNMDGQVIKILYLAIDIEEQKTKNLDFEGELKAIDRSVIKAEFRPDGFLVSANDMFAGTLGYTKQELEEIRIFSFLRKEDMKKFEKTWRRVAKGMPYEGRICKLSKTGKENWFTGTYNAVKNFEGEVYKIIYIAYDITARKQKEIENAQLFEASEKQAEELITQKEKMRKTLLQVQNVQNDLAKQKLIMSGQLDAINKTASLIEYNLNGDILSANNISCELFGYVASDIIGRHHRIFIEANQRNSEEYKTFWKELKRGNYKDGTFKRLRKDGTNVYIKGTYTPLLDPNGTPHKIMCLAFDITESITQEAEMSGQLEAINKTNALVEFKLDGTIISANNIFCDLFGYKQDELIGRHHRTIVDDVDKNSNDYNELWSNLRNGHYHVGEFKRITKSGKEIYLNSVFYPMLDVIGRPFKIMKLAFDITEGKRQEQELKQKAKKLAENEDFMTLNMEELKATQEEMEGKQKEIIKANKELKKHQASLEKALQEASNKEEYIQEMNSQLIASEEELRQNMEELQATQDEMERKQQEIERAKNKLQTNEEVLKKAFMKAKEKQKEVVEMNTQLITSEEEIKQNMEELHATQEEMERKQQALETSKLELSKNEKKLKETLKTSQLREKQLLEKLTAKDKEIETLRNN